MCGFRNLLWLSKLFDHSVSVRIFHDWIVSDITEDHQIRVNRSKQVELEQPMPLTLSRSTVSTDRNNFNVMKTLLFQFALQLTPPEIIEVDMTITKDIGVPNDQNSFLRRFFLDGKRHACRIP